eukprot:1185248-Rhodomonas_salina.3
MPVTCLLRLQEALFWLPNSKYNKTSCIESDCHVRREDQVDATRGTKTKTTHHVTLVKSAVGGGVARTRECCCLKKEPPTAEEGELFRMAKEGASDRQTVRR